MIQLQDQWNVFCRDLVIRSWKGGVQTLSGRSLQAGSGRRSETDALDALRRTYTGKLRKSARWEPKWFDATETIEAATRLGLANLAEISAGVGLTPAPLDEIRAVRNFMAHRGRQSSAALRSQTARSSSAELDGYLCELSLGGAPRFETWVAQLDVMAYVAVM